MCLTVSWLLYKPLLLESIKDAVGNIKLTHISCNPIYINKESLLTLTISRHENLFARNGLHYLYQDSFC